MPLGSFCKDSRWGYQLVRLTTEVSCCPWALASIWLDTASHFFPSGPKDGWVKSSGNCKQKRIYKNVFHLKLPLWTFGTVWGKGKAATTNDRNETWLNNGRSVHKDARGILVSPGCVRKVGNDYVARHSTSRKNVPAHVEVRWRKHCPLNAKSVLRSKQAKQVSWAKWQVANRSIDRSVSVANCHVASCNWCILELYCKLYCHLS